MKYVPLYLAIFWCSCVKNNSDKQIESVVFRFADNPALGTDVPAFVSDDSVHILLTPSTDRRHLIPTITFNGSSIEPNTNTAQDFTKPVIYTITAEDGTLKTYTFNSTLADSATLLLGKWAIIKDSVTNDGIYTMPGGGYPIPATYVGRPEDYYLFKADGMVDAHENNSTYTGHAWRFVPGGRLWIEGISEEDDDAYILTLTYNRATFFWEQFSANGGRYSRTLRLQR